MATAINGIEKKVSADLTVSGRTVTAPAGYYASDAFKMVAEGALSNVGIQIGTITKRNGKRAIPLTPYAIVKAEDAGYIHAGTGKGEMIYIITSDLVSGTLPITENGTYDVTDNASVSVNIPQPIEWDTWVFKDSIACYLSSYTNMSFEAPMYLADGRFVAAIYPSYYDSGSTDHGSLTYYIGTAEEVEVYTYEDYGSTDTWTESTYKTIKVPSYVRNYAYGSTSGSFYNYRQFYKFLQDTAALQT